MIRSILIVAAASVSLASIAQAETQTLLLQSTTSTKNSGLFDHILPVFNEAYDAEVRVVSVGTGQALRNAQNCDADVLLVHSKVDEDAFVAAGYGVERFDLMYNDFIIVGPASDPAGVRGETDAVAALLKLAEGKAPFASRGDDSGTHKKELILWEAAGIDVEAASGGWYRELGSGMGATLNASVAMGAYVLTDRSTWLSFGNKADFEILVEGDPRFFNQYGVIQVSPDHCATVNAELGAQFVAWAVSEEGQAAIASYVVDGQQLFFPNATAGEAD